MYLKNIKYLFSPKTIALLGCSEHNLTGTTLRNLLDNHYQGKIYPVHPRHEKVFGIKCYKQLSEIPDDIDCCVVGLRADLALDAIDEMVAKGVKAAVIYASGFAETGPEGKIRQDKLTKKLKEAGIAACGPNCAGFVNFHDKVVTYMVATDISGMEGPVGIVSHSGSICVSLQSARRGLGFSFNISCGNEGGLSIPDYLKAMVDDKNTEVIVSFMETIRDPDGLIEAAALALSENKPILALKIGRSEAGKQSASAHSGSLAGSSEVTDVFLKNHHILQVRHFDEINEAIELLARLKDRSPRWPSKIALTGISGGLVGLSSDLAEQEGVEFARINESTKARIAKVLPDYATAKNPLDVTTALFDTDAYKECIRALSEDPEVGLILCCQDMEMEMFDQQVDVYSRIVAALCEVSEEIEKPMVLYSPVSTGVVPEFAEMCSKAGIPVLQGINETMNAVKLYFEWMEARLAQTTKPSIEIRPFLKPEIIHLKQDLYLSEKESKQLLKSYDIQTTREFLVKSPIEASIASEKIGYPLVMKIDSADIIHKTEAKAVRIGIANSDEAAAAYQELIRNARDYDPGARINGVSVQEMIKEGVEMMLGMKNDPVFGPIIMVGLGGINVELFRDLALEIAPISYQSALKMITSLKSSKLLLGYRGSRPADIDALCDAIVKFSQLAYDYREEIMEMDVNPIIVLEKGLGAIAVDALIVRKQ